MEEVMDGHRTKYEMCKVSRQFSRCINLIESNQKRIR